MPVNGTIETELTRMLGIQHPIMLAGMNGVSHSDLAAAVSNAGGIGSIGGLMFTPKILKQEIDFLKKNLKDPSLPFGVDLAIPQIGGSARKTNHDYTGGKLAQLIDIIIAEKAKIFICAVGVPPKWVADKLHAGGVLIGNMVGSVRNAEKAIEAGADILIAQGTEGGGHTGEIGTMVLIPQIVDVCKGKKNFFGGPIITVAAGGIYDGRGLAASLALGATGAWVGTRFIACDEASAPKMHKDLVVNSTSHDTIKTLVMSGRPLRLIPNKWVKQWEADPAKMKDFIDRGVVPLEHTMKNMADDKETRVGVFGAINSLAGQCVGGIKSIESAEKIVHDMMQDAMDMLRSNATMLSSKL